MLGNVINSTILNGILWVLEEILLERKILKFFRL